MADTYTSLQAAQQAADKASGCRQPCACPAWTGPRAVMHEAGDRLSLVCQRCHKTLIVTAKSFVALSLEVPQDAEHANYMLACDGCGATYQWTYWAMPVLITP